MGEEDIIRKLGLRKLPRHIAVIMDGNGRWAKQRSLPRIEGHKKGADAVKCVVRACRRWGIPVLTLFAFSRENWSRPPHEVEGLMELLRQYVMSQKDEMIENGIRLRIIGRIQDLREDIQDMILDVVEKTSGNQDMILNLALSYSGRWEIVNAAKRLCREAMAGRVSVEELDEEGFSRFLDTGGLPDPDLLIRTSGEQRISNFLLWQLAYTEIYFTETLWPDFSEDDLIEALRSYEQRERRFGRISEQLAGG